MYNNNRFVKLIKDNNKGINDINILVDNLKMTCEESIEIQEMYADTFKLNFGKHKDKHYLTYGKMIRNIYYGYLKNLRKMKSL